MIDCQEAKMTEHNPLQLLANLAYKNLKVIKVWGGRKDVVNWIEKSGLTESEKQEVERLLNKKLGIVDV